ncbi:DUF2809 domain-containing protein [Metabacillus sp. GX 13764]|uniref:ribosomal maturation YjgA family protein n=1 Tax=Metabacillus kandeliae TaxID=2900151 RepID=UPI001E2EB7AC|nr:DUF2809 domain-containing protein [Metabacillus kandeliae]MCD7035686.1 DUF2809 domain-containing protein [Metabacillus kandeliae]
MNKRIHYAAAIFLTILLGLSSRKFSSALPGFLAENAGDVFWAMMVYFIFRFLLVKKKISFCLWASLLFSFGIEFSQLYQTDWANNLRSTVIGGLVFGRGFLIADLFRYTAGIVMAGLIDRYMLLKE